MGGAVFPLVVWPEASYGRGNGGNYPFKRSYASTISLRTVAFMAPDAAAGVHRPTPPPETPGHLQASLAQSLVGSLFFSPHSCCVQGFVCAL